jgi:hypothetical protein
MISEMISELQKQLLESQKLSDSLAEVLYKIRTWDMISESSWIADAQWARELIDKTLLKYNETKENNSNITCDVIPCNELAVECHGGEIYFCQWHYEGAAAAQKAGIPVELAYIYKP